MAKPLTFVSSFIVAIALALPSIADAQASRRGGGSSGDSGSGSSGSAMPRDSSPPPSAPSQPSQPSQPSPSRPRTGSDGPSRQPESRVTGRSSSSRPAARAGASGSSERTANLAAARARNAQGSSGVAQARGTSNVAPPPSGSWGRWYPSRYGYGIYNPWLYGSSFWTWQRYGYGYWHDPFLYDPYGYGGYPYYWNGPVSYGGSGDRDEDYDRELIGSVRLRANPRSARVYVDGALAGVVDDFDGLSDHLDLPAGSHQIELRADGYASQTIEVDVKAGKTRTERVNLSKQE